MIASAAANADGPRPRAVRGRPVGAGLRRPARAIARRRASRRRKVSTGEAYRDRMRQHRNMASGKKTTADVVLRGALVDLLTGENAHASVERALTRTSPRLRGV